MKNTIKYLLLLLFFLFSSYYTNNVINIYKDKDIIMRQIKENDYKYNVEAVNAVINDDTIIPGIYGKEVNIKKSYQQMKKYGSFNEELLVYNLKKSSISLSDNKDKYIISGNPQKRNVSLIFKLNNNIDINEILNILNSSNTQGTFFVDDEWFNQHNDLIYSLINQNHTIGILSHNLNYQDSSFGWMDTIIKNVTKQKQGYCYYTNNIDNLNSCVLLNDYTIKPVEVKNNYFYEVKHHLKNGVMISFDVNKQLEYELKTIINYIKSKGYNIVNLEKLLQEK